MEHKIQYKYVYLLVIVCICLFIVVVLCWSLIAAIYYAIKYNLRYDSFINFVYTYNEIFKNKDYDIRLQKNVECNSRGICIFDVGGNLGLYSMWANQKYKNADIHMFEPIPFLFSIAHHNIASAVSIDKNNNSFVLNNFGLYNSKSHTIINYFQKASALSTINNDVSEKKTAIMNHKCGENMLCRAVLNHISRNIYKPIPIEIELITMYEYINRMKIEVIDILKIDVEGVELEVLRGMNDYCWSIVKNIIIEVENYDNVKDNLSKVKSLIATHGFQLISTMGDEQSYWIILHYAKQ